MPKLLHCAPLLAVVLALDATAGGRVLLVDAGGSTPYPTIQSAVNAAVAGDLVFVMDHPNPGGTYAGFTVSGLGITVMARPTTDSRVAHAVVSSVPAGESVALIGLSFVGGGGVQISQCTAPVHVNACTIQCTAANAPALRIESSTSVTVAATHVTGDVNLYGTEGVISIVASVVELDRCIAVGRGGHHVPSWVCTQGSVYDGGPGLTVTGQSASVRILGGSYIGGNGGYGGSLPHCDGWGASGLIVSGGAVVFERGALIESGNSGSNWWAPVQGPLVQSSETPRDLDLAPVADADGGIDVEARGVPGDQAWLVLADAGGSRPFGLEAGTLGLDLASLGPRFGLGTFDGNGRVAAHIDLGPAVTNDVDRRFVQLASHGPLGTRFSATNLVLVLGPSAPLAPEGAALHVDPTASTSGHGRSWSAPIIDVEDALRRAIGNLLTGGEVWLHEGEHLVGSDGVVVDDPLRMRPGTRLLGGFRGDEASAAERDPVGRWSVLTGDALGDDLPGFVGRSDNARRILRVMADRRHGEVLLDRLWIRGVENPTHSFKHVLELQASGRLVGCRISDSRTLGDLVQWWSPARSMERCELLGNIANNGVNAGHGPLSIVGCLVVGNRFEASGIRHWDGGFVLSQSTLAYNSLTWYRSAVETSSNGGPALIGRIENSILWNNARSGIRDQMAQFRTLPGHTRIEHCCIGGWDGSHPGTAVHGLDPRFRAPLGADGTPGTLDDDFRLLAGSPCVDAGNTTLVPLTLMLDLDGRPRVADDPATPDTGTGGPPVVDMGAYER